MILYFLQLLLIHVVLSTFEEYQCDINVNSRVCLDSGSIVLEKYYQDPNLFGYWNFDNVKFVDRSKQGHLTKRVNVDRTFSAKGFGSAAQFAQDSQIDIFMVPSFSFDEITISFVLYFDEMVKIQQPQKSQKPLLCGLMNLFSKVFEGEADGSIMRIGFDCFSRNLVITYFNEKSKTDEVLIQSTMRLQPQIWYNIYIVKKENVQLYVNGFLEGISTNQKIQAVWNHLIIGNILNEDNSKCPSTFTLDSLYLYTNGAASDQFNGYADIIKIGCLDCAYSAGKTSCSGGFHICGSLELFSFGINVARDMGWVKTNDANFWSGDTNIDTVENQAVGNSLCCRDIQYAS